MFTIKQAARIVGAAEATLRTWERRYGIVAPHRSEAGYRLYDPPAIAALTAMRKLVDAGWSPSNAAAAILDGQVPVVGEPPPPTGDPTGPATAATCTEAFLASAARIDMHGVEAALDQGMATGSFEHVVDTWLLPALVALGEGWARGEIDVAGEHMASHQVLRRLSAAFEAAGSRSRGRTVVVGLPPGSRHELGALSFATALRRLGLGVLYLGADVPEASWLAAVQRHGADAAVLSVVTAADRPSARLVTRTLKNVHPELLVASGGAFGTGLGDEVHDLPYRIGEAAEALDRLVHADTRV